MKRIAIIAVMLFVLVAQMFAATYTIRSYSFNIIGKTTKAALSEFVGEPGATFESLGDLEAHVADKCQQLYNKRIFYYATYTYELEDMGGDVFMADVEIEIEDAETFIIVPFPKYDSNYGFEFKFKVKDANFLGTFSTLDANISLRERNNSFKESLLAWDLTVDAMRIKDAKLSVVQSGALDFQNWAGSWANLSANISGVTIGKVGLSGSLAFKATPDSADKSSNWSLKTVTTTLGTSVSLDKIGLSNSVTFTMVPDTSDYYKPIPESITDTVGLSFKIPALSKTSLSSTFKYVFASKVFTTATTVTSRFDKLYGITGTFYFATSQTGFGKGLDTITPGVGVSRGFTLFKKVAFSPSMMVYFPYAIASKIFNPYMVTTLPFSYGAINWVDNNFRKGFVFSLTGSDTYYFKTDKHSLSASGSATFHHPVTSWFNPSARLNFKWANTLLNINSENAYSWNMRGIRDDNADINKWRKFGMTLNLDLMFNFIRAEDFCSSYAIFFTDVFVGSNDENDFDTLFTVGAEGIIILDSHPSYPIRASLGFNGKDLGKCFRGEIGFSDVEFELLIGLYFFY